MKFSEEKKRVSDMLATWVTIVSVLSGGVFALVQYFDAKAKERVERTMASFTQFSEPALRQQRILLQRSWDTMNPQIVRVLTAQGKRQDEINRDYDRLVRASIAGNGDIQSAVIGVMEFLEGVAVCVQHELCDAPSARALFGRDGKTFFRQYYPYLCELRAKWRDPSIGLKLEEFFNPASVGKSCRT